jgi:hypothetical protein
MSINPKKIAIDYYFGDLQYWKIPGITATTLEEGYDGPALRRLAGFAALTRKAIRAEDFPQGEIDSAFREMGVDASISECAAQMALAEKCAAKAVDGQLSFFDAATHIRILLCHLSEPPAILRSIVCLSKSARNAPESTWSSIEADLKAAFQKFLSCREASHRFAALGGTDPTAQAAPRRRFKT